MSLLGTYKDEDWKLVRFLVYDMMINSSEFVDRYNKLKTFEMPSFVRVVEYTKCLNLEHFKVKN